MKILNEARNFSQMQMQFQNDQMANYDPTDAMHKYVKVRPLSVNKVELGSGDLELKPKPDQDEGIQINILTLNFPTMYPTFEE